MRPRMIVLLLTLAGLVLGCGAGAGTPRGGASGPLPSGATGAAGAGSAQRDKAATDALAKHVLPALVDDLGVQVRAGAAAFVECELRGWRYQADGDLVGGTSSADDVTAMVRSVLGEQHLDVEVRADGSVVGRDGDLSLLVGAPLGPPSRSFRHYTLTHACTSYPSEEASYLRSTPSTDYGTYVPLAARYAG